VAGDAFGFDYTYGINDTEKKINNDTVQGIGTLTVSTGVAVGVAVPVAIMPGTTLGCIPLAGGGRLLRKAIAAATWACV
jgi:hypothetical protein